jgi:hypothetical protein
VYLSGCRVSRTPEYVRVYQSVIDDPKFDGIYDDDRHFAAWVRLLMAADATWPASCQLPASARKSSVKALVEAGIVDLRPGNRFRIRGLDAERERRAEAGRVGGKVSGSRRTTVERPLNERSTTSAGAVQPAEPSRAETEYEPSTRDAASREPIDRIVDVWLSVKYRLPSEKQRAFLFAYLQTFDVSGEARAERLILSNPADPIEAMKRDLAEFREERVKTLAAEVKAPPPRRPRGLPTHVRELAEEWERQARERAALEGAKP